MRPDRRKLVRKALEFHAPMSDAQLAWLLEHFGMKPATTKKLRHKLTVASEVRFARKVTITESGHVQKLWELVPIPKPVKPR